MVYPIHDPAITTIRARPNRRAYGMGLGIILLDDVYPGFPGDVRNASGYPFPIQYEIARDVDIHRLVVEEDKSPCLEPVRRAAQHLEEMGCRAIAAECGYFAYFQREIAASVRVPVFMSSLLQVPFAQQLIGPDRVVGILMAEECYLSEHHLRSVGIAAGQQLRGGRRAGRGPVRGVQPSVDRRQAQRSAGRWVYQSRSRIPGRGGGFRPPTPRHGRAGAGVHRLPALRPRPPAGD